MSPWLSRVQINAKQSGVFVNLHKANVIRPVCLQHSNQSNSLSYCNCWSILGRLINPLHSCHPGGSDSQGSGHRHEGFHRGFIGQTSRLRNLMSSCDLIRFCITVTFNSSERWEMIKGRRLGGEEMKGFEKKERESWYDVAVCETQRRWKWASGSFPTLKFFHTKSLFHLGNYTMFMCFFSLVYWFKLNILRISLLINYTC